MMRSLFLPLLLSASFLFVGCSLRFQPSSDPLPTIAITAVSTDSSGAVVATATPTEMAPTPMVLTATDTAPAPTSPPDPTAEPLSPTESPLSQTAAAVGEPVPAREPITELQFVPPADRYESLSSRPVTAEEARTGSELALQLPPARDDVALAAAYRGVFIEETEPTMRTEPLPVGTKQMITLKNIDANINVVVEAELMAVGDHAYFWFDQTPGNSVPNFVELEDTAAAFDDIYEQVVFFFGQENQPGIDGDLRVHVVNGSPQTICNSASACGLLGYYSSQDRLPRAVYPPSNERDMFVMNGSRFGTSLYLEVLAHEFRHMIEDNYDRNDIDWKSKGRRCWRKIY